MSENKEKVLLKPKIESIVKSGPKTRRGGSQW